MNDLLISKTTLTPQVQFLSSGNLLIKGVSTPENTMSFYRPLFNWISEFKSTDPSKISLILEIDYLNSTSTKAIVELLILLNNIKKDGVPVEIMWRYESGDDDMQDLGMDLQVSSKSELVFVPV
jgi:hypothetical protein